MNRLLLLVILAGAMVPTKSQVSIQDSLALVDLYYATSGSNWNYDSNWLINPPVGHSLWLRPLYFRHLAEAIVIRGFQTKDYTD